MNITPDAWQADTEALQARAEKAEARIQAVRELADVLAASSYRAWESSIADAILGALDGTDAPDPQ